MVTKRKLSMEKQDCYDSPNSSNKVLTLKKAIYDLNPETKTWININMKMAIR